MNSVVHKNCMNIKADLIVKSGSTDQNGRLVMSCSKHWIVRDRKTDREGKIEGQTERQTDR